MINNFRFSELDRVKPTRVINTAGARGSPNVDWCEDHKDYTVRSNIIGAANLVDCCFVRGIHITHFASGCIYDQDEAHPLDGTGFTEEDAPNFWGSFYSYSKMVSEKVRNGGSYLEIILTVLGPQNLSQRAYSPYSQPSRGRPASQELCHQAAWLQEDCQYSQCE